MKRDFTIVVAPDSFKESMSAKDVCIAMEKGIKKASSSIRCIKVPMADGGEGTMESLVNATNGKIYTSKCTGPLGEEVIARYGILGDGETGVVEMAESSGINLIKAEERNPLITTTYGTGELIKCCLDKNVKKLLLAIGGSATNDGGVGAISALGGRFLDKYGKELDFGGGKLYKLSTIDLSNLDKRLKKIQIEVACDVTNPLYGKEGASFVFGKQKGADKEMMEFLDNNLKHYSEVTKNTIGKDFSMESGAGAAGGLGFGLMAFLNANLKKGIDLVIKYSKLEEYIKKCDIVFTGEGSIDFQTQYGKTPIGVAILSKKYKKPVIAFCGKIGEGVDVLYDKGIDSIFGIMKEVTTIEEALESGKKNVEDAVFNVTKLLLI